MAGPWEQYQTPTATPEAAPWLAYQGQTAQQDDHGYAPAPPKPPAPGAWMSDYHEEGTDNTDIAPRVLTPPGAVDMSAYREPGTDNTDIEPRDGIATRLVNATTEGFREGAAGRTDPAAVSGREQFNRGNPINTWVISPGLNLMGGVLGAAGGALGQGAYELGNLYSPELGRDAYMGAQVIGALSPLKARIPSPADMAVAPRINPNMKGFEQQTATPRFVPERFAPDVSELDPRNAIQTLIQHDMTENPPPAPDRGSPNQGTRAAPLMEGFNQAEPPPAVTPPPVPTGAPVPGSVGAAASRDLNGDTSFGRSAREIKGQQADMELADLMRTPQPGDARDIIPGAAQTKAEIELNPSVSREAKGLRQEFREGFNDHEKANNELYHRHIDDVVPPREDIATMKDVREQRWQDAEKTVFGDNPNGEPVSAASVVDHINRVLSDPKEKFNSYLRKAFQPFLDALTDDNGQPITLGAKELYGLRAEMARKVKDMATDTDLAHVRGQFGDLLDKTDSAITTGAPEYRTMMDNYKADSGPINAAERLADMKLKVTNGSDRVITFGAMDRYMKSLWMERHGPNPYAPAKSIPQETWDHLMTLHERLARSASADELARTKGSDTTQLMMEMARKGAIGAAHLLAAKVAPGLGNLAVPYITKQIDTRMSQKRLGQHLNPDVSQYPPVVP